MTAILCPSNTWSKLIVNTVPTPLTTPSLSLSSEGEGYRSGYKVQRLVVAWKSGGKRNPSAKFLGWLTNTSATWLETEVRIHFFGGSFINEFSKQIPIYRNLEFFHVK